MELHENGIGFHEVSYKVPEKGVQRFRVQRFGVEGSNRSALAFESLEIDRSALSLDPGALDG